MSNPENSPLKKAQGLNAPQYFDDTTGQWEYAKGKAGSLHVKDADIKAELALIKAQQVEILAKLNGSINTNTTGNFVGVSTSVKPTAKQGDSYIELDTKKVFLHDGTKWGEF